MSQIKPISSACKPVWDKDKCLFQNRGLPSSLRLLIIGSSNCGKSFLLQRLLLERYLDYNSLYLFTPSLHQTEYQILIKSFEAELHRENIIALYKNQDKINDWQEMIKLVAKKIKEKNDIKVHGYDNNEQIPVTTSIDKTKKNLFIFDDCAYEKQSNIHSFFSRGRHNNINCIYLSQSYFQLPRRSIRANSNCFIFFSLNDRDTQNIWQDIARVDYPNIEDFKALCKDAWSKDHGYLFVDTTKNERKQKYIINHFDASLPPFPLFPPETSYKE